MADVKFTPVAVVKQPSIKDLAYRGLAAALGGPVDIATMVMRRPVLGGYKTPDKQVVGSSEWIGKQMEDAGLVSTARAPWQELAASMVSPSGAAKGAALGLGKLGALGIVKNEGGNWIKGSIDQVTHRLKKPLLPNILNETDPRVAAEILGTTVDDVLRQANPSALAVNRWLDTQFKNHIQNKLGTINDPVRLQAEQRGILHFDPAEDAYMSEFARLERQKAGMPLDAVSTTALAKRYEDLTDPLLYVAPYSAHAKWGAFNNSDDAYRSALQSIGGDFAVNHPEAIAANIKPWAGERLAFDHLTDELYNSVVPNSDLPQHLRLKPKDLKSMSVPQAVEHVYKINNYRTEQARLADLETMKANLLQKPFKEYTDGWRWSELPDANPQSPDDIKLIKNVGCQGGWCTKEEATATHYGSHAHGNKLYALFDKTGRPHIQIHTKDNKTTPPDITQIMPFSNTWESQMVGDFKKKNPKYREEITPMLQDFVRSQEWGNISKLALSNAGLSETAPLVERLQKAGLPVTKDTFNNMKYVNDAEILEALKKK